MLFAFPSLRLSIIILTRFLPPLFSIPPATCIKIGTKGELCVRLHAIGIEAPPPRFALVACLIAPLDYRVSVRLEMATGKGVPCPCDMLAPLSCLSYQGRGGVVRSGWQEEVPDLAFSSQWFSLFSLRSRGVRGCVASPPSRWLYSQVLVKGCACEQNSLGPPTTSWQSNAPRREGPTLLCLFLGIHLSS